MEYLEYLQFLIPIIGIVFIGWVSGLSPYTHNKKLIIQIIIFLLATGYTFITHDSHEWIHFVKKETLPSIAMVLGITGILVFNFTIIPKNQTSLFILLGFITPILSNIGTSLMVLPILIGSTPYLFRKYGKMKGLLILIIVSMMAANTLAVFTAQADLPTTAYVSDMKLGEEYTQGKSPFEVLRPVGLFAFMAYIIILFIVGVKPKFNELTQIGFKIQQKSSFVISIALSGFFILIMNINIWYLYLAGPVLAFILAKKAFKLKKTGENNIRELKTVYIETIILFVSIFSLIQCIPFTIVEGNKFMIVAATIIETMSSDNLIAFQANKYLGYGISWDFGTQWVLLSSIF